MSPDVQSKLAELNQRFENETPHEILTHVLHDQPLGKLALISSFGAESVVLLHLVAQIDRATPVIFLDTEYLFEETLSYQKRVADALRLSNVVHVKPAEHVQGETQFNNSGMPVDTERCCFLRKTLPMKRALADYAGSISGRKRYQSSARALLPIFEWDMFTQSVKVNPVAKLSRNDIQDYIQRFDLPRHPLIDRGYTSIGCAPCTSSVSRHEDPRAGRWRGQAKTECGLHSVNGQLVREYEHTLHSI